ncbi:MAG TPA: low affinity iron permease family protein [Bdellovibrionales bacterium]|nr:low affinity iron permease family protein [Bdellovibrionales bacterium]
MSEWFRKFAHTVSNWAGQPFAFLIACLAIVVWVSLGPAFNYTDTWQLIINTGTTIATFLMVFLIQNTQNRDARAIHLKLDELIRSNKHARNAMIDLEELSDAELDEVHQQLWETKKLSEKRIHEVAEHRRHKNKRRR